MALLEVKNLSIGYHGRNGLVTAVEAVSFNLNRGRTLGFVGESGCGKTTIGMALLRLLPENAVVLSGNILFEGKDLLEMSSHAMREIRWKKIAMIFQAAMNALNPVKRVADQIAEALLAHEPGLEKQAAIEKTAALFDLVGIPENRLRDYPHQYSGGMKQRAIIAMALACQPLLLIADEPTTALDVIVQDQILKEIRNFQEKMNIAMVFISHDISVVADVCDDIAVMYDGWMVETGRREEVLTSPAHPYTKMLLASNLTLNMESDKKMSLQEPIVHVEGPPGQCRYYHRCREHTNDCRTDSYKWVSLSASHRVLCKNVSSVSEV